MADMGKWEIVCKNPKKIKSNAEILNAKNISKVKNGDANWLAKNEARNRTPRLVQSDSIHESEVMFNVLSQKGSKKAPSRQRGINMIVENDNAVDDQLTNGSDVVGDTKESKRKTFERPRRIVEKPPKSLEEALRKIPSEELRSMMQMVQMRFPESCNIWLKDLISYLNIKLNVEIVDPTFAGKDSCYPVSAAPKDIRTIIEGTIQRCSNASLVLECFDRYLVEMAEDMTHGLRCNGHRIVLQAMVRSRPSLVTNALPRFRDLLNVYQNRPAICLTLLWVASSSGTIEFDVGLKVWLELFLPVLGIRAFSKYVVDNLRLLLSLHPDLKKAGTSLGVCNYFPVLDTVFNNTANLPAALHKDLLALFPKLKIIAFIHKPETNMRNYFPSFLSRLNHTCPQVFKAELIKSLVHCLRVDAQCFFLWKQLYSRHLVQSSILLEHLSEKLNALGSNRPLLKNILHEFSTANQKLSKSTEKGIPDGLRQCRKYCTVLAKAKMEDSEDDEQRIEVRRRTHSSSILHSLFFVLCVVLGSAVIYDCQISGSFGASKTSHLLHDYGVFSAYQMVSSKAKLLYGVSRKWAVKNIPLYYATFTKFATPYIKMIIDWMAFAWNVIFGFIFDIHTNIVIHGPIVFQMVGLFSYILPISSMRIHLISVLTIDKRFPLLVENIMWGVGQIWAVTFQVIAVTWAYITHIAGIASVWMFENVFVGPLAVDKLQQHMHSAIDHVHSFTIEAFNWIKQQIHTSK